MRTVLGVSDFVVIFVIVLVAAYLAIQIAERV